MNGTAEIAAKGGYQANSVIASFLGAFPMDRPRYVTFVLLFEPKRQAELHGQITAGVNAAPVTSRVIARIAPILGLLPRRLETRLDERPSGQRRAFDVSRAAQ